MSQETESVENLEIVAVNTDTAPGEIPVPEAKPKTDKEIKYEAYLVKYDSRIKQWRDAHWRTPAIRDTPPIVWDSEISDYVWMNREWRRQ